jgi:alkylhydroperoxidase family enzyme
MARIEGLDEQRGRRVAGTMGPEARRVLAHRPEMADAIGLYNQAVANSHLEPRLHEYVRFRLAEINDCPR